MRVDEFDFDLPAENIAQHPTAARDASRLLALARTSGACTHHAFDALAELLRPGDLLVLNDTRVLRARLDGRKSSGGRVEALLLEPVAPGASEWTCLIRASRPPREGAVLQLEGGLAAQVLGRAGALWTVRFDRAEGELVEALERSGRIPLPPYIRRDGGAADAADAARYQTVFARHPGAVAAPTAGLHFTERSFRQLAARGVETAWLTLHTGAGTFLPVRVRDVERHRLHAERFTLPAETAAAVERARSRGGRVIAVGTTVVRTLEYRAAGGGRVLPGCGRCDLFIYPGFRFGVVDAMVTNFHLPRSTLLMLVCAFAGREAVLAAYREALGMGYRFYSYGDAMLIG